MILNVKSIYFQACLGLILAVGLACGGSGKAASDTPPSPTGGTMNVRLVDAPSPQFQEINLNIQKVEIHQSGSASGSGWITLGTPNRTINLLTLTGGISETLVAGASLPPGQYEQMRLLLGTGNTVKLQDGSTADLTVPSGLQSGVKLPGSFTVMAGTTSDIFIDFDAAHSIQLKAAGASSQFILRPVVKAFDKTVTGSISGTLMVSGTGAPLVGATVFAETYDNAGNISVVRAVTTSASGTYSLDLLPTGSSYFVVSQPVSAGVAYDAQSSAAIALTTSSPTFQFNTAFTAAGGIGSVSGTITPAASADQSDEIHLMQTLSTGGTGQANLIIRSGLAIISNPETYTFEAVPTGNYAVVDIRTTLDATGTATTQRSPLSATFSVLAGLVASVGISL